MRLAAYLQKHPSLLQRASMLAPVVQFSLLLFDCWWALFGSHVRETGARRQCILES